MVSKNVQLFLDKLRLAGFHISKAYIFGSYVRGQVDKWSDIDVAIDSPQIRNDRFEGEHPQFLTKNCQFG